MGTEIKNETMTDSEIAEMIKIKIIRKTLTRGSLKIAHYVQGKGGSQGISRKGDEEARQTCYGCGIEGHIKSDCTYRNSRFFNATNEDFGKSQGWGKVKHEFPNIMDVLNKPRIPSDHHLQSLEGMGSKSSKTTTGGSPNDGLNMISQCCELCKHAYVLSDNDESINMLITNTHQSYFNYTIFSFPRRSQYKKKGGKA